jgi:putative transposase
MRHRRPRLKSFDYTGLHYIFLTFCTHHRQQYFADGHVVDLAREQILRSIAESGCEIHAYVFMPDHVHLLVKGVSPASDLRACAVLAKQRSGYEFARRYGGRLWQPSYYDHVVRDEEGALKFMAYIAGNPVRAGLVRRAEDYPFLCFPGHDMGDVMRAIDGIDVDWQG